MSENKRRYPVNYSGYWNIQEEEGYGGKDLLDADVVGEKEAEANAKLAAAAPEMQEEMFKLSAKLTILEEALSQLEKKGLVSKDQWIDVEDKAPELYQSVSFVVSTDKSRYRNRVFGGVYTGNTYGYHSFAVPGISFTAKFWQPLPAAPE